MATIYGAISDVKKSQKPRDGKVVTTGTFNFETLNPSDIWQVKVSQEHVELGIIDKLKSLESTGFDKKPVEIHLEYREGSMAGEGGKHVSWNGFHFVGFADEKQAK